MKDGPDIARVAALIGDPARANILTALMSGKALTASELAAEAGVSAQTCSSHLGKLQQGGMIRLTRAGRHRYFALADEDVAKVLEALMGLAAGQGHLRSRTGPRDPALRHARVCYNHLAGEMGVQMYRALRADGHLLQRQSELVLSDGGQGFLTDLGLDLKGLPPSRAPLCRECLDWSARESHLAGRLGRALLTRFLELSWAKRLPESRIVKFTTAGQRQFDVLFPPGHPTR